VHAETVEQYYQQRVGRIFADESPLLQLDAALQAGVPRSSDDLTFRLLYEMHALCEASDAHALLMQSLYERELLLFEDIINGGVRAGQFAPHLGVTDIARTLVALEDGLGLHVMSRNASSPSAGAIALLQRCAHDLVRPVEA